MTRAAAFAAALLVASVALAETVPRPDFPRRRVVVIPPRDFRLDPDSLFVTEPTTAPDAVVPELGQAAVQALAAEPEVEVVVAADLARGRDVGGQKGIVARGFLHLGMELYRQIRLKDAIAALEKGVDAASAEFLDVTEPELVSDLHLYLGLSYLEQGSTALAHVAFKNLFFVTPQRRFRKGYFPANAEAAIRSAAIDFQRTYAVDVPLGSLSRVAAFRQAARATGVVYVCLVRTKTGDRVEVRVSDPSDKGVGFAVATGFSFRGVEEAREGVGRAVSSWLACAGLPSREPVRLERPRFLMDTSGAYSLFLRHPTREPFHAAGFGAGFAWQVRENLDTFARVNLFTSLPDRYDDLVQGFTSVRLVAGVGYSGQWSWGRIFLHFGLEGHYLSDFVSSTDPDCKLFGTSGGWCDDVNRLKSRFLSGINGAAGIDVVVGGPIYLAFQTGFTAYFFPFPPDSPLNFPFTAELGLGYAFF